MKNIFNYFFVTVLFTFQIFWLYVLFFLNSLNFFHIIWIMYVIYCYLVYSVHLKFCRKWRINFLCVSGRIQLIFIVFSNITQFQLNSSIYWSRFGSVFHCLLVCYLIFQYFLLLIVQIYYTRWFILLLFICVTFCHGFLFISCQVIYSSLVYEGCIFIFAYRAEIKQYTASRAFIAFRGILHEDQCTFSCART